MEPHPASTPPPSPSDSPQRISDWFSPFTTVALVLLVPALVVAFWVKVIDADLFLHLKAGEVIWQTRAIPQTDPFSATARGTEWVSHEWLWEVAAWALQNWGGWLGLSLARLLAFAAALLLAMGAARLKGSSWFASAVAALVMTCALMSFPEIRPQNATFVFFAFSILLLEAGRRRPKLLLVFPPLVALWANLHGAFLIFFPLAAVTGAGWLAEMGLARRRSPTPVPLRGHPLWQPFAFLCAVAPLSLAASLLNPHGIELITYPLRVLGDETFRRGIAEWLPPDASRPFLPFYVVLGVTAALCAGGWRRLRAGDWMALGLFTALAFSARRHIPFFTLALLPAFAASLTSLLEGLGRRFGTAPLLAAKGAALAGCLALFPASLLALQGTRGDFGVGIQPDRFPERAATILASLGSGGTVLNDYNDGGYLIWRLWPRWKVVIDGRADLYGGKVAKQYARVWTGSRQAAAAVLKQWGVDAVIGRFEVARISPRRNLYHLLAHSEEWKLVHWNDTAMLYLSRHKALAATDTKPYRRLHPALSWSELVAMQTNTEDLRALAADTRRAISEHPESRRARYFARKANEIRQ